MSVRVLRPGALTTVQDLGRGGLAHLGVAGAGAADPLSLRLANRLVGNRDGAAALELTLAGPRLVFEVDAVVALVGGRLPAHVDDVPVAMGQTLAIRAGQTLALGRIDPGLRAYLAVAGGIRVPPVLGSRATDTLAGLGPAALAAGDRLPIRAGRRAPGRYLRYPLRLRPAIALRVMPGPRADWFTPSALETLLTASYRVEANSDRTGLRLHGPRLQRAEARELGSEGMITGALQVPPDGQPIMLLPNHSPTGGYPVIATVVAADTWRAGQARPGQNVSFQAVSPAAARGLLKAQARYVEQSVTTGAQALLDARELLWLSQRAELTELAADYRRFRIRLRR